MKSSSNIYDNMWFATSEWKYGKMYSFEIEYKYTSQRATIRFRWPIVTRDCILPFKYHDNL